MSCDKVSISEFRNLRLDGLNARTGVIGSTATVQVEARASAWKSTIVAAGNTSRVGDLAHVDGADLVSLDHNGHEAKSCRYPPRVKKLR
jgi:hypothetical protein